VHTCTTLTTHTNTHLKHALNEAVVLRLVKPLGAGEEVHLACGVINDLDVVQVPAFRGVRAELLSVCVCVCVCVCVWTRQAAKKRPADSVCHRPLCSRGARPHAIYALEAQGHAAASPEKAPLLSCPIFSLVSSPSVFCFFSRNTSTMARSKLFLLSSSVCCGPQTSLPFRLPHSSRCTLASVPAPLRSSPGQGGLAVRWEPKHSFGQELGAMSLLNVVATGRAAHPHIHP